MRTTFSIIHLLNDSDFETCHCIALCPPFSIQYKNIEWKRVGRELYSGGTERERGRETVSLWTGYGVGNKLDHWTNIYYSLRKDSPRSYQDEH
jgi:hypothetical protein